MRLLVATLAILTLTGCSSEKKGETTPQSPVGTGGLRPTVVIPDDSKYTAAMKRYIAGASEYFEEVLADPELFGELMTDRELSVAEAFKEMSHEERMQAIRHLVVKLVLEKKLITLLRMFVGKANLMLPADFAGIVGIVEQVSKLDDEALINQALVVIEPLVKSFGDLIVEHSL